MALVACNQATAGTSYEENRTLLIGASKAAVATAVARPIIDYANKVDREETTRRCTLPAAYSNRPAGRAAMQRVGAGAAVRKCRADALNLSAIVHARDLTSRARSP